MAFECFFTLSIISSLADALKDIVLVREVVYAIGWMAVRLTESWVWWRWLQEVLMTEGREPFPDRALGATGGGCGRGAFYSEEHPVTIHRLVLCWCLSRRDNGGGYAGLELRKMRRKWELVSALCVVEGARVRMYTWWRHWTTFVYFDPFIHLHIEGRLLEMKTVAHLVCAVFSLPRMLFFMWWVLNKWVSDEWLRQGRRPQKKRPARPEALEVRCQRFERRHRCPG